VVRVHELFKRWIGPLLILLMGLNAACTDGADANAREVVVYCSADTHIALPLFDAFTRETGIRVRFQGDTEATKTVGLVEKLRAEKNNPRADVFWSSDAYQLAAIAREGLFGQIDAGTFEGWPASARDIDGRWIEFAERARVLVRNSMLVSAERAPQTLWELTDKKWKDRVVMARPQFGTTRSHIAALVVLWGEQAAGEWLALMHENGLRLVDGNSTVVREVGAGTAHLGLTDTDDVWAGKRNGWPVKTTFIAHDYDVSGIPVYSGGAMVIANAAAPIVGGPNPTEAQAFIRFLVSERAERILAESDSHNLPVRPGLAEEYPDAAIERPMRVPVRDVIEALSVGMRLCEENL